LVTLSASIGTIIDVGDGAWTWFLQPTGVINNQTVTITATDKNGGISNVTFLINAQVTIASRAVVYNNATSPGGTATLAGDKVALLPGQTAKFANYTNYSRGLNGLVVDFAGLPSSTTELQILDSFQFSVWNGLSGNGFASLPTAAVPSVAIERGAGVGGSARVRISFPDNTLQNTWLRVEVLANTNTGLVSNDVFYFGNIIGDLNVGNVLKRIRVNALDISAVRNNFAEVANSSNPYDLNRDGRVDGQDVAIVRNNQQPSGIVALISAVPPLGRSSIAAPRVLNPKWDDWSADPLDVEKQNWWGEVLIDEKGGRSNKSLERSSSMQSVDAFFESY
jgi:hypothetical protein